ncbi:hypothetical protein IAU59_006056 [Kwoniella sp. CBS 9459]
MSSSPSASASALASLSISLPKPSPTTTLDILIPLALFTAFYALYAFLAPHPQLGFAKEKQRAYILSTLSSGTMTLVSIPYLWSYASVGFEETFERCQSGWMAELGRIGVLFFATYLCSDVSQVSHYALTQNNRPRRLLPTQWCESARAESDYAFLLLTSQLLVGYLRYPAQVGLLTGWIHHIVYIGLMVHLLNSRLSPVFLMGSIMELPTFDLAISNLFPSCRNDLRFLSSFFIFRIAFHAKLLFDCLRPHTRLVVLEGSWVPGVSLGLAMVLHVLWFKGGVAGYLKRRSKARLGPASANQEQARYAQSPMSKQHDVRGDRSERQVVTTEDAVIKSLAEIDPTVVDTLPIAVPPPSLLLPNSPETSATTPEWTPLMTPRTPSGAQQTPFNFPALPQLPTVSIPSITLPISITSLSLPLPSGLNINSEGFKEAVKSRWEGQRERFSIRRRKPTIGMDMDQDPETNLDEMIAQELDPVDIDAIRAS